MQAQPFESTRLSYRAIEPTDEWILQLADADAIAKMNGLACPPQPESSDIAHATREWLKGNYIGLLVCLKGEQAGLKGKGEKRAIGWISLQKPGPWVVWHRGTSVTIMLLEGYRGKGYGTEAIEWALDYAFGLMGLHSVSIGAYGWNEGARRLYERMGFRLESRRKEVSWFRGRWWDTFEWGMLEGEWRARRKFDEFGELMVGDEGAAVGGRSVMVEKDER